MLMASGRKPIMAAEGTELDADGMRNMIMKGQEGRTISDKDRQIFMDIMKGQEGRSMSDKDVELTQTGRRNKNIFMERANLFNRS